MEKHKPNRQQRREATRAFRKNIDTVIKSPGFVEFLAKEVSPQYAQAVAAAAINRQVVRNPNLASLLVQQLKENPIIGEGEE